MLDPGTYAWQNPMSPLLAAIDHLEMARMGLDIAASASAALELVPEAARMAGLEHLHAHVLHPMAFHLSEALGAGRWLLAGYVSPEMLRLMAGTLVAAWRTGQAAPRMVDQMLRAAGPEWRGHVGVTREWLGRTLANLQSAIAAMQMLMGPRWEEVVQEARPYVTRWVAPELREVRPEVRPEMRPEVRPELRPEVRPELRPELRPEMRPEMRPEAMPMPHPGAHPGHVPATQAWPGRVEPGRAGTPPVRGGEPNGSGGGPAGQEGAPEGGGDARPGTGGPGA